MRKWFIPTENAETVGVLLYPRFSNLCLANAIEPLRAANMLSGKTLYRWQFLTTDGAQVRSSSGMPVLPDARLADSPKGDYLFVLPSYGVRSQVTVGNLRALRAAAGRYRTLAGMDTGSWLLAAAGLLDGRRATIHWDELTQFEEAFDQVEVRSDRFVRDGSILTCGGVSTTFDLVLDLIGRRHGEALRLEVSALFTHAEADRPPRLPVNRTAQVDHAVAVMRANIETPLDMAAVAALVGLSQRRLEAAFARQLGATPRTVYKRPRLAAARRYAEQTDFPIAEIALRCGYQTPAALTRAFVQEFGQPPTAMRRGVDG